MYTYLLLCRYLLAASVFGFLLCPSASAQRFKRENVTFKQWLPPGHGFMDGLHTYQCVVERAPGATYRFPISEANIFPPGTNLKNLVRVERGADLEFRAYFGPFTLVSIKEENFRDDGERRFYYSMEYSYPITYEVIHIPTGRYLHRQVIKPRKTETMGTYSFPSRKALRQYWKKEGGAELRDLEMITVADAYRDIHKSNKFWFEYYLDPRNINFSYVKKSRDYDYPEFEEGLALIKEAAAVLTDSLTGMTEEGERLVYEAIEAWYPLTQGYIPDADEGRINDKVYREANLSIAYAYSMINDLDQMAHHLLAAEETKGGGIRQLGASMRLDGIRDRLLAYPERWEGQLREPPQLTETEWEAMGRPEAVKLGPVARFLKPKRGSNIITALGAIMVRELEDGEQKAVPGISWSSPIEPSVFAQLPACRPTERQYITDETSYPQALFLQPQGAGGSERESISSLMLEFMTQHPSVQILNWERNQQADDWYAQGRKDSLWQWLLAQQLPYALTAQVDTAVLMPLQNQKGEALGYDLILRGQYYLIDVEQQCAHAVPFARTESQIRAAIGTSRVPAPLLDFALEAQFDTARSIMAEDQALTAYAVCRSSHPQLDSLLYSQLGFSLTANPLREGDKELSLSASTIREFKGLYLNHPAEVVVLSGGIEERLAQGKLKWEDMPPTIKVDIVDEALIQIIRAQENGKEVIVRSTRP